MNAILKTEKLRVVYGGADGKSTSKVALQGLDLEVKAGEVFGFLGPNGAGKTTTMNVLLGFVRATSGQARLFDVDVRSQSPDSGSAICRNSPTTINFSPRRSFCAFMPASLVSPGRRRIGGLIR